MEVVVGVVFLLQCRKPLIIRSVIRRNALFIILAEVIDVDAASKRMQRTPAIAGPSQILCGNAVASGATRLADPKRSEWRFPTEKTS